MRIFEGKVNFLMICFKFCSSRIPLVFEDQKKKKKGRLSRPLRKPRHTHRERRCSITSLHSRVKCAGTLQSFWLLVVRRLTGWRQRVGSWMMLEKQTIRHVTNASQRPRKPSGYVSFSLSLFFCPSNICVPVYAREKQIRRSLTIWLICMLREKK